MPTNTHMVMAAAAACLVAVAESVVVVLGKETYLDRLRARWEWLVRYACTKIFCVWKIPMNFPNCCFCYVGVVARCVRQAP